VAKANLAWGPRCTYSVSSVAPYLHSLVFLFCVLVMNFEIFAKPCICRECNFRNNHAVRHGGTVVIQHYSTVRRQSLRQLNL